MNDDTLYAVCPADHWGEVPPEYKPVFHLLQCACGRRAEPRRANPATQGYTPAMQRPMTCTTQSAIGMLRVAVAGLDAVHPALSTADVRAGMLQAFPEVSPRDRTLHELGREYHRRCEAFDQGVCSNRRDGVAIPATRDERAACSSHATQVEREILERPAVRELGITRQELRRAIQQAA